MRNGRFPDDGAGDKGRGAERAVGERSAIAEAPGRAGGVGGGVVDCSGVLKMIPQWSVMVCNHSNEHVLQAQGIGWRLQQYIENKWVPL